VKTEPVAGRDQRSAPLAASCASTPVKPVAITVAPSTTGAAKLLRLFAPIHSGRPFVASSA
jgi:hypothetical protein